MILDISKHEANQKKINIKISFGYDVINNESRIPKEYLISVMAHPKDKRSYIVEYRNAKFKHSRGKAGRSFSKNLSIFRKLRKPMLELFKQVCKRYMNDSNKDNIDHEDYVRIEVSYIGEELASDAHTVCEIIEMNDLSLSTSSEENYEVDELMSFFMSYYALVERLEL